MPARHVPQRACHQAPALFEPLPLHLEDCRLGGDITIRLRARCKRQLNPRRPEHSRGLWRLLVGSSRWPSLAQPLLFGLRDTCPSNKADRPQDSSRMISPNGSSLRWSTEPADSRRSRLQSLAERTQRRPISGCTARPKAVCPRLRPRVRRLRTGRRPAEGLSPLPTLRRQAPSLLLRLDVTPLVTEGGSARDDLQI